MPPLFSNCTLRVGNILVQAAYCRGANVLNDTSSFMLASHTIVPNYRINTSTPTVSANQKYHVSALSFEHSPWVAKNYVFCWQNGYTNNTGSTPAEILPPTNITMRALS